MPSIRCLCRADIAPICATYEATFAKMVAFMHAPSITTTEVKSVSLIVTGLVVSPMTIISAM